MSSNDFEKEKKDFNTYYDKNTVLLEEAKDLYVSLIKSLITHDGLIIDFTKIEGRVKKKEECIKKFSRKYRSELEKDSSEYEIKEYITDIIGLRIVCLYEDDVEKLSSILTSEFDVIEITDKTKNLEKSDDSFGYKGLHLDLKINESRSKLQEYKPYCGFNFEIQIRTIIQDAWSVLDHKIKYKKAIEAPLKRRINILAALFELADREFREIRDLTQEEIKKAEEVKLVSPAKNSSSTNSTDISELNAFNFLNIGRHFFKDFTFEPYKVDGFVEGIHLLSPGIQRSHFHNLVNKNISNIKKYMKQCLKDDAPNPFKVMRYCLYAGDSVAFDRVLSNTEREDFDEWKRA